jgi:hypothetical protein
MSGVGQSGRPGARSQSSTTTWATEFERAGWRGGLNYYQNFDRNWWLLFVAGHWCQQETADQVNESS